ncbi:uncharacterized protein LOC117807576 [Notolabrus celidotus]|uniref:uncharacterized protein LOC117807576 n=1 Tax=Notolabrus celidotus TaxID=1203425 RepID=UPI00148F9551|nr:uncharacterized protein LOC117807576 [Notolabrus celidotus]
MNQSILNSASEYYWAECLTYDDGPSTGLIILFITYGFEFLVGAPSNIWLVCQIHKQRSEAAGVLPADFFPLHMALTQLAFFLTLPVLLTNHILWQSQRMLNVFTLMNSMVMTLKPLLHCLVCVDWYMAVVRPTEYLRFKGNQHRYGCMVAVWSIYILMASIATLKRSPITACTVFLPVLAIDTFCSLSVLKTLRKAPPGDKKMMEQGKKKQGEGNVKTDTNGSPGVSIEEGKQASNSDSRREGRKEKGVKPRVKGKMNSMKRRAFNTIVIIQGVLTLNYLPFIITLGMDGKVPAHRLKCQYVALALAAAMSCSYLNPLLYLHRLGRLNELKKLVIQHLYHSSVLA